MTLQYFFSFLVVPRLAEIDSLINKKLKPPFVLDRKLYFHISNMKSEYTRGHMTLFSFLFLPPNNSQWNLQP